MECIVFYSMLNPIFFSRIALPRIFRRINLDLAVTPKGPSYMYVHETYK